MSDDFDKDDLSWLTDPEDDEPDEEDETFDWQGEKPKKGQSDSERLGVTGELPWLGDDKPSDSPGGQRSGLTGELPWMGGEKSDDSDSGTGLGLTGELPWMGDDQTGDTSGVQSSGLTGELSWLGGEQQSSDESDAPQFFADDDDDDFLFDVDEDIPAAPLPQATQVDDDVPDWLRGGTNELSEPQTLAPPSPAEPDDVPDWLRDDEPEAPIPDAPDWLTGAESEIPADEPIPDAPDWLMSAESETPAADVPDWLLESEPEAAAPAALPDDFTFGEDFFSSLEASETELDAAQAAPEAAAEFDADFLSAFGESGTTETDDALDWLTADEQAQADEPATPADSDFFNFDELEMPSEQELLPDWLETDQDTAEPLPDDFLSGLGLETPASTESPAPEFGDSFQFGDELDPEFLRAVESQEEISDDDLLSALEIDSVKKDTGALVEDYISSLSQEEKPSTVDWFAEQAEPDSMDWLQDLGDLETPEPQATTAPSGEFFFGDDFQATEAPLGDIDSILAGLDESGATLPDTGDLIDDQQVDMDTLFSDPAFSEIETPRREGTMPTDMPDFLTELGASVSAVSAAAMLRQQKDRPLDELSDRLQKLRDRGEEIPTTPTTSESVLPGVTGGLVPSVVEVDAPGLANTIVVTPEQQRKIDLLKSLAVTTGQEIAPRSPSAIDLTYDTPFLTDEDELPEFPEIDGETAAPAAVTPVTVRQPRVRPKVDRILIALILAAAVIVPFYLRQLRIGSLPPALFAADSEQQRVFDTLQALDRGDLVLVAAEYGATASSELDTTTSVLLQHIFARGALPVVVSGNPVNVLRMNNLVDQIAPGLQPNDDYYIIRYLSGEAIGVRALAGNMTSLLANDIRGQATNLNVNTLGDFAAVVVIAERPDELRTWAEQISPITNAPVIGAIGAAAEPLTEPYLGAGIDGLLVGYRDAYTYGAMLASPILIQTTEEPTVEPTEAPIVEVTEEATAEIEATAEVEATAETDIITPTVPNLRAGVITASTDANVRQRAASDGTVIGQVAPGVNVIVLDESADGQWVKLLLDDGSEGWIAANLVRIIDEPAIITTLDSATVEASVTAEPTDTPRPTTTPTPSLTNTPLPTATQTPSPTATATPTATQTPVPTRIIARVIAADRINVRSGPSTDTAPLAALNPGTELDVIGRNGDGSWIQVLLEDGREGWVSAGLVELRAEEIEATPTQESSELIVVMADGDFNMSSLLAQTTDEPTEEATIEVTEESTVEVTIEATEEETSEPAETAAPTAQPTPQAPSVIPYGEERWYAMNMGLTASIMIILLGALVNIARAILRRGKR